VNPHLVVSRIACSAPSPEEEHKDSKGNRHQNAFADCARDRLDPVVAGTGRESEQGQPDRPDESTRGVEHEESPVGHPGHPGQSRHDRTKEGGESSHEHGSTTVVAHSLKPPLDLSPATAEDTEFEDAVAEMASDPEAHGVAKNGTDDRDSRNCGKGDPMLIREHSAEQNRGFARQYETHEQRRLAEGQSADQRVGGGSVHLEELVDEPAHNSHGWPPECFATRIIDVGAGRRRTCAGLPTLRAWKGRSSRRDSFTVRCAVGLPDIDQRQNRHERRGDQPDSDPERDVIAMDRGQRVER
jgi:hypothetical protein